MWGGLKDFNFFTVGKFYSFWHKRPILELGWIIYVVLFLHMKVHSWRGQRFLGMFQRITEAGQCVVGYESLQGDLEKPPQQEEKVKITWKRDPSMLGMPDP